MMNFYNFLIKEEFRISFKDYEKMVRYIYDILIEIDKFRKDNYHKIFHFTYMVKQKQNQEYIVILLENRVIGFMEKPKLSISDYAVPPFYIFSKEDIKTIKDLKWKHDSLRSIIEEVVNKIQLKAFLMPSKRLDLGS